MSSVSQSRKRAPARAESHAVPRLTYVDQNERDYRALQDAAVSGRISAHLGI